MSLHSQQDLLRVKSQDACNSVHTLVLKGPVQQALLHCNNARAAGRTQARRLLRFDTQASIAAS
jgi:hypothetical protein